MQISATNLIHDLSALEAADFSALPPPTFVNFANSPLRATSVRELPLLAQGIILRKVLHSQNGDQYKSPTISDFHDPQIVAILNMRLDEIFIG